MFRDGVDTRPIQDIADRNLRRRGWTPISEAPIANTRWFHDEDGLTRFRSRLVWIEALTASGLRVMVHYHARGDYQDRWEDASGHVWDDVTHFRMGEGLLG